MFQAGLNRPRPSGAIEFAVQKGVDPLQRASPPQRLDEGAFMEGIGAEQAAEMILADARKRGA